MLAREGYLVAASSYLESCFPSSYGNWGSPRVSLLGFRSEGYVGKAGMTVPGKGQGFSMPRDGEVVESRRSPTGEECVHDGKVPHD